MEGMYYFYVLELKSSSRKRFYFGYTSDLKRRFLEHAKGKVITTKDKNPELVYYEAYGDKYSALAREKSVKSSGSVYNGLMERLKLR